MDAAKVLELIKTYREKLVGLSVGKIDYPHEKLLPTTFRTLREKALEHCHGMLDKMEEFARESRMEKLFRWLGFVQGVLWVLRIYTLEELKNHNNPPEEPSSDEPERRGDSLLVKSLKREQSLGFLRDH